MFKDSLRSVPENHYGIDYLDFVGSLSEKRRTKRYLEIGVGAGALLKAIYAEIAVAVDPYPTVNCNVIDNKKIVSLVSETSDRFFSEKSLVSLLSGSPDFVFLDGFHVYDYLLRDFINSEAMSHAGTLIAMHDCLPLDDIMIIRYPDDWGVRTQGSAFQGYWTGDVWKMIPILQKYREDLKIVYVDCPPTGVVCVTNLDPDNTVLKDNYLKIIQEFNELPNDRAGISELYNSIELTQSKKILRDGDHSLFFKL